MATTIWPALPNPGPTLRGMKRILEEAGQDLSERSNGALRFHVRVTQTSSGFLYTCLVLVEKTANIRVEVCSVETGLTSFPAALYTADGVQVQGIKDEAELLTHLAAVFQSERTKEILVNLIANFG